MKHATAATMVAFAVIAAATAAIAAQAKISVSSAWIRALPGGLPAAGYFTLHNNGESKVVLTRADSAACGMLMLHKSEDMSGASTMSDVSGIEVAAGGTLAFKPGDYHLMCMRPAAVLKPGAHVPVTLHFSGGSEITVSFAVRTATGQ
jgi:copper(I)-binding protein